MTHRSAPRRRRIALVAALTAAAAALALAGPGASALPAQEKKSTNVIVLQR